MARGSQTNSIPVSARNKNVVNPRRRFEVLIQDAIQAEFGLQSDALVSASRDPLFDLQSNAAMSLGKKVGLAPKQVADRIAARAGGIVSGPGFINYKIPDQQIMDWVKSVVEDPRLGVSLDKPISTVVDYSGPNVAKELHVGHVRSTLIGDALVRMLEFKGHPVKRQNHLGDYGTQFGMLIEYKLDTGENPQTLQELGDMYKKSKQRFDNDALFKQSARDRVSKLQNKDPETVKLWQSMVELTLQHIQSVYGDMDVLLTREDVQAESSYGEAAMEVVEELKAKGILEQSDGAWVYRSKHMEAPLIVQKSNHSIGYGATDLAAIKHRVDKLHGARLVYVTDSRQADHFKTVFDVAAAAGWTQGVELVHANFGSVLGADGKPFKTRSGETFALTSLLEEAKAEVTKMIADRKDLSDSDKQEVVEKVALASVKYADLSSARHKDYRFDVQTMTKTTGDTGPYLQYAEVRAKSILAKSNLTPKVTVLTGKDRELALKMSEFEQAVSSSAKTLEPHKLAGFLHSAASEFSSWYQASPVLGSSKEVEQSRLALAELSSKTLEKGLDLLGISTLKRM